MMFVAPILYVISQSIMIAYKLVFTFNFADFLTFSILDESQKITIPCDNLHLMAHSADQLILISKEKRVFKLTLIDTFVEKVC